MQRVSEIMTTKVQTVSPQDSVRHAAQMMSELNVGALPVCDGERLVGMVTDRDITVRAVSAGIAPEQAVVDDVMSTEVRWCFEDQPLDEVMQQMAGTQIRRIPVVSHDQAHRLVGIISLGDLATKADDAAAPSIQPVVEQISSPSEPDRSSINHAAHTSNDTVRASDTGTAAGLAGSDVLAEQMNPDVEVSSTADPSDIVEVTPDDLVNRNAPGSTTMNEKRMYDGAEVRPEDIKVVRRNKGAQEGSDGSSATSKGVDVGASGGTAGTAGSAGTEVGSSP